MIKPVNVKYEPQRKLIKKNWKPIDDAKPRVLGYDGREHQKKCFKKFAGERLTIFISPTGSGKSLVQVFNAGREILESDYRQKQVFIVPQLNIGNGFSGFKHGKLRVGRNVYGWHITEDCCKNNNDSVKRIRAFLLGGQKKHKRFKNKDVLGGCTAVVSYPALIRAFKGMSKKDKLKAIKNVSFRIDEVHHISGVDEVGNYANELGKFTKFVLDNKGSLHLTTATFFRGDKGEIISQKYLKDFCVFRVPFLDHWKTLGLKSLNFNYNCYKNSTELMHQIIEEIKKEPNESPLVIVPADNAKFFRGISKARWVKRLVVRMEEIYGKGKVLDLVNADSQKIDKHRLTTEKQDFSAIVTCQIGKEGTDWPACSRIHNTLLDGNILQLIQKLGRALRPYKGKTDVVMTNYIKEMKSWGDSEVRDSLSDLFNTVMASSMLDDMFYPLLMPTLPQDKEGNKQRSKNVDLEEVYGEHRGALIDDMMRRVFVEDDIDAEKIDEIIEELIVEYSDLMLENVDHDVLKDRLRKELLRRQNPNDADLRGLDGITLDFIRKEGGWDKVVKKYIANNSPFHGKVGTKDLKELKKFLNAFCVEEWAENFNRINKIGLENLDKDSADYRWWRLQCINRPHWEGETNA